MFSFEEARQRVLERVEPLAEREQLVVKDALGRILADDVRAPFDIPPLPNSARDGYALRAADLVSHGSARLQVVAEVPAGQYCDVEIKAGQAARIFTGAPMPPGADTVVMQEYVQRHDDVVEVPASAVKAFDNVRPRGEDVETGDVVLERGTYIRPQEVGILAALGLTHVWVNRRPRVAVISTGNEVVEAGETRGPAQIFDSNRYSLIGLLQVLGAEALDFGIIGDERDELRQAFLSASEQAHAILTSGGVSVGAYDLVRDILNEVGSHRFLARQDATGRPAGLWSHRASLFLWAPRQPGVGHGGLSRNRPAGALAAHRAQGLATNPLSRPSAGDHPQAPGLDGISARHPDLYRTRLGSGDHRATGLGNLALDGQGELPHLPGGRARRL